MKLLVPLLVCIEAVYILKRESAILSRQYFAIVSFSGTSDLNVLFDHLSMSLLFILYLIL